MQGGGRGERKEGRGDQISYIIFFCFHTATIFRLYWVDLVELKINLEEEKKRS